MYGKFFNKEFKVKKYACHRVYDSPFHYIPQAIVCINDDGTFGKCMPLLEEWIGGIIVLSGKKEIMTECSTFDMILQVMGNKKNMPLYAWHISNFDFEKEELTKRRIVRIL